MDNNLDSIIDNALDEYDKDSKKAETAEKSAADRMNAELDAADDEEVADEDPVEAAMRLIRQGASGNEVRALDADELEAAGGDDGEGDGADMDPEAFSRMMAESMKSLGLGENGEGMEGMFNPEMMQSFMMQMMQEMMSKENLYDPIKDLATRLPQWLEDNKDKVPAEVHEKHSKQLECYQKIVAAFDADPIDNETVQRYMIEVQTYGPPPTDLVPEEHRAALDEMMAQAPPSSQDDAEALRQIMQSMGGAGGDGKDGAGPGGCPMQ